MLLAIGVEVVFRNQHGAEVGVRVVPRVGEHHVPVVVDLHVLTERESDVNRVDIDAVEREGPRLTLVQRGAGRRRYGIPTDAFLVTVLGRLAPIKDHAKVIRSVAASEAHLLICGEGPLEAHLRRLAGDFGAASQVHFHGGPWTSRGPRSVDAVALTSRNEGTPLALVDAQAAGLPVVATDVGGVRDVVATEETGLLVEPGDVPGLTAALQRLGGTATSGRGWGPPAEADARAISGLRQHGGRGRSLRRTHAAPASALASVRLAGAVIR